LADLLQADENTFWPQNGHEPEELAAPVLEHVQRVYAHRWQVPREVWWNLFSSAEQEIGILVYSGLFFTDDAGMLELLKTQAKKGVNIRILLGDPTSQTVRQRGEEERIGGALAARARNALLLFHALREAEGVEIRIHSSTLYNSIYLTEKQALVNHHVYGFPAAKAPVLEIHNIQSPEMFSTYVNSFQHTWSEARVAPRQE
jgi:hypothetical protein